MQQASGQSTTLQLYPQQTGVHRLVDTVVFRDSMFFRLPGPQNYDDKRNSTLCLILESGTHAMVYKTVPAQ
jgi:hypothetical protein